MKIVVTGGAGYLGSVLVPKLIKKNYEVIVLDKLLYGKHIEADLIEGDIRDVNLIKKILKDADVVIHLAGIVGETAGNIEKDSTISINFLATRRIAEICKKNGIKLIYASTCSVYGARPDIINEESQVIPLSIYSLSKYASEEAILKLKDEKFKPVIFRMGTLFGYSPRMRFDLVINLFIGKAIKEGEISVYGGNQWRPFLHVEDASNAYLSALKKDFSGIFNIGGRNYQIIKVADIIKKHLNCEINRVLEIQDKRDYKVSSNEAEEFLGIKFENDVEDAIKEIKYYFDTGKIKDYKDPIFSNAKFCRNPKVRKLIRGE